MPLVYRFVLPGLFALSTLTLDVASSNQLSPQLFDLPTGCKKFIDETLKPNGWTGEFFDLPRDWKKPINVKNPLIRVFFYWDPARDSKNSTPVIFFNGGPVSTGQARFVEITKKLNEVDPSKKINFVFLDQRGNGCSVPNAPYENQSFEEMALYGSEEIVEDAEFFRNRKFGPDKKWKIFSQSYGAVIANRYLIKYPKSILEIHNHAPASSDNFVEFFYLRIMKQQEMVKKFFEHYKILNLERAFEIANNLGKTTKLCLPPANTAPELCGRVLVDGALTAIGQGYGRALNSFSNWEAVRDNLLLLINGKNEDFLKAVGPSFGFFRNPTSKMVGVVWAQDVKFMTGNNFDDCEEAYKKIQKLHNINRSDLILDECRIVQQARSSSEQNLLKENYRIFAGRHLITKPEILNQLQKNSKIRFFIYTGELDTLVQVPSVQTFIESPLVKHTHFESSGHAGWLFEPLLWSNLTSTEK